MNDNIFRLFLVLAYIITKLFTFQVLFAHFCIFYAVHSAHFLLLFSSPFVLGCIHQKTSADLSTEVFPSRSTPASQGYKDSNLEMTESESVAFFSAIPVITRLPQIVLFGIDL